MDFRRNAMLILGVIIYIVTLVSGQADMSVTYSTVNWFPVGEQSTLVCQVEHTENRDALSVYWSRQKEGAQTFEKIGAYDSRDNSTYKYASAPQDISDRFVLPDGDAYDDEMLTATSYILDTNLNDAGTYQCEVEDTKAHMAKAAAFLIQVYSLPSSVTVADGKTSLSLLPVEEVSGDGAEEAEAEPIASCIVEGVYPLPSRIDFTNDDDEVLGSVSELVVSEGEDGLYTVTADLFLDASKSLHGQTIGCTVQMADGIDISELSSTRSSTIEVLYPSETLTLTISPSEFVNEGDVVSVSCAGDGNPAPEVYITGPSGEEARSSFSATYADEGEYICSAEGLTASSALEVYYLRTPTINGGLATQTVKIDERIQAECTAEGSPAPTINWFKDDEQVSPSSALDIVAEKESAGVYSCVATNDAGTYSVDFEVGVQYGCSATFTKKVSYSKEGGGKGYVELTCVATGDPTCQVSISGDRCDATATMGENTCIIPDMEPQSEAPQYTCTATNGVGTADVQILTLDDEPVYIKATNQDASIDQAGMPAGGIAAIIIIIALVVIGVPAACYYCRRQRTPSTKNAKAMEAGEDEKLADAENQE